MKYLTQLKEKLFAPISTVPAIVQGTYYPSLNGLRGIAILMVIGYHFGVNYFLRSTPLLVNGDIGVNVFFVISGFLITTLLLKEQVKYGSIDLNQFYLKRVLRIVPVAYLFLLVLIVLNQVYKFHVVESSFVSSLLFYKNLPYQQEPFMGHFWTLAAEMQFYLIFPLLLVLNINRYLMLVLSIVIIVPVISVLGYYHVGFMDSDPVIRMVTKITKYTFWNGPFIILIGSLAAVFLFKGIIRIEKVKDNYFLSFLILLVAVIISTRSFLFYSKYVSEYLSAILVAWVILLNLKSRNFLSAILSNPVLVKVGVISYSLYIWQQLFWAIKHGNPGLSLFILILMGHFLF
ncbi:acyltransferase family protein [Mucilaginibacter sp.]|uniref:acyltransferase family protein n=1 Tax=Mucilaginibacter sp. TaxID=1882438 RepID=UPI003D0D5F98